MIIRGVGRWFGKGGLYRSIGKGSMISVYKIEPSYVTIRKHRGAPAPGAPMVPTPMGQMDNLSVNFILSPLLPTIILKLPKLQLLVNSGLAVVSRF